MRTVLVSLVVFSLLQTVGWSKQPTDDVEEVAADYVKAHLERDKEALKQMLCDDYTRVGIDGQTRDRSKVLALLGSGDMKIQAATRKTAAFREFGDTTIWTGTSHTKGTNKEKTFEHKGTFTTVLVKQDGAWKIASDQVTPLRVKDSAISGAWKLFGRLDGDGNVVKLGGAEANNLNIKFFSNGIWFITYVDTTTADVTFHHGGTYTLDGNKYEESIEFATEATQEMVGNKLKFTMDVDGDVLTQRGIDNPYNEVWHRVLPKGEAKKK